jgi:uncharacterized protein (TIGR02001 family)
MHMNHRLFVCAAASALMALPSASQAQLAFNAGVFSDYRYRGISQTRLKPAVQAGVDYAAGGLYVGAWASSIKWIKDLGGDANAEIDVYGGYKGDIVKGSLSFDVGVLTYQYPSNKLNPKAETTELYGALSFGPATVKYSHSVSNLFGFANSKGSGYLDLSASFDVGGVMLAPHLGYQTVSKNGDFSYLDYSLTVSKDFGGLVVSLAAVGSDTKKIAGKPAYASPVNGKDLGKAGAVLGLKYTF